jgi:Flp pilus assembly pilin Flp
MTEYIIIVGLIAILLVAAVGKFKTAVQGAFNKASKAIDKNVTKEIPGN